MMIVNVLIIFWDLLIFSFKIYVNNVINMINNVKNLIGDLMNKFKNWVNFEVVKMVVKDV